MRNKIVRRVVFVSMLLLVALIPTSADAERRCNKYSDGCTICDFYGPNGEYQGSISWCF
jgi:hypothetical protein